MVCVESRKCGGQVIYKKQRKTKVAVEWPTMNFSQHLIAWCFSSNEKKMLCASTCCQKKTIESFTQRYRVRYYHVLSSPIFVFNCCCCNRSAPSLWGAICTQTHTYAKLVTHTSSAKRSHLTWRRTAALRSHTLFEGYNSSKLMKWTWKRKPTKTQAQALGR